jgi:hypothetical protein
MSDTTMKATCSCCKRKRSVLDLVSVSKRRSGSYNRAGSGGRGKVCRQCTIDAVRNTTEARYRDGLLWGVYLDDNGIAWSDAADYFGIDWSDVPRTYYHAKRCPDQFLAPKAGK